MRARFLLQAFGGGQGDSAWSWNGQACKVLTTRSGVAGKGFARWRSHTGCCEVKEVRMRRNKTAAAGAICGVLCALCVLGYTQSVRGEAERARADALARYGGDQVEV